MFRDGLQKIVDNVEGGIGGLVMGFDGIAVESYTRDPGVDVQTVGMEFSFILTQVRKAADILEVGGVRELAIKAEGMTVLIRVLSSEYFVALALKPEGNFGKGRYLLRSVGPKLAAEL
jgi:predicted regulator of Ras-like GTPase activity (Roadblock/LC7/MglB family)